VLDASDAALRAAAANLDNARSARAARDAEAQALAQEARYADTVLSFTRIVAPMDGVVVAREAEVGTTVVPGGALPAHPSTRRRCGWRCASTSR
jgi:multidrug resistance efflux pump